MQNESAIRAKAIAEELLTQFSVPSIDVPYIEAIVVAAILFELPIGKLAIGINDNGDHYKVTVKGYRNLINDVVWVNTFMGQRRDSLMKNVEALFTQLTDHGSIKVLQVRKMQQKDASMGTDTITTVTPAATRHTFRKRGH
jgi:hypothetical protein